VRCGKGAVDAKMAGRHIIGSEPIRDIALRKLNRVYDVLVGMMLVVAACAVVHGQVTGYSFVNWDDDLHVVRNAAVSDPGAVPLEEHLLTPYLGYPVPVTVASYILDHRIGGMNPSWYHTANLLFHLWICIVIFLAALRLGCGTWLATAVAVAFAVHPVVVEPVAWVSGRKDLLAALFSLLSVTSFLAVPNRDRRIASRIPAFLLGLLASLSKPSALLVPALLLILDLSRGPDPDEALRAHPRPWRRWPAPVVWMVLLAMNAGLAVVAWRLESGMGALEGAGVSGGNWFVRVLAGAAWHARIIAWPFDLMPKYLDPAAGPAWWMLVFGGVVMAGVIGLTVRAFVRRSPAFVGLGLAVLAYIPQSGVVPLSRQYANSYVYLTLAGLALAAGAAAAPYVSRVRRPVRLAGAAGVFIVLAGLGLAAHSQEVVYKDGVSLWSAVYGAYPDSPQVCRNLGNAWLYGDRDEPAKAAATYEHCINTMGNRPFFLKNLAVAKYRTGDVDAARALFLELVETRGPDATADKYLKMIEGRP